MFLNPSKACWRCSEIHQTNKNLFHYKLISHQLYIIPTILATTLPNSEINSSYQY
jgi:hypothetical protein